MGVLLVFAFVLAIVAAFYSGPQPPYWRLPHPGWLAIACYFGSLIFRL